jgi:hypothetical protein
MIRIPPGRLGISIALLLLLLRPPCAIGQGTSTNGPSAGTLSSGSSLFIQSDPIGAVVTLSGPYEWVGQTPWRLLRDVTGVYKVEARMPGYETWRDEVSLGPRGVHELNIRLGRRTKLKALGRSLLIPGWGQDYQGETGKGIAFTSLAVLSVGGLLWTHIEYQDRVNDFNRAKAAYEASTEQPDLAALRSQVQLESSRAEHAFHRRNIADGIAAGVWAFSALDVLLFSSGGEGRGAAAQANAAAAHDQGLRWSASAEPQSVRAGLSYSWR